MTIAAELSDDIEELKRLLVADRAEPAAAKAGLLVRTLEVEKLKIQIAQLKRKSFGASSEPMRREVEQLELKLEELETAEAEDGGCRRDGPGHDEGTGAGRVAGEETACGAAPCAKWARMSPRFWITPQTASR